MRKLDSNAHSVFLLYYHLILVIKYRKTVLNDPILNRAKEMQAAAWSKKSIWKSSKNYGRKCSGARAFACWVLAVPQLRSSVSTSKHRERVKVNTVYRFRIYPNKAQRELFVKTFGCVRFVYNRMLAEKKAHYEKTGKNLSVTPARYKSEFP